MIDNTIQKIGLKNENILKLEIVDEKGNSTGEYLEFDYEVEFDGQSHGTLSNLVSLRID